VTPRVRARAATSNRHRLGEGPVWDAARDRLLWVDIDAGEVLIGALEMDGSIRTTDRLAFAGTIGAVAVAANGDLIIAGAQQLLTRRSDGTTEDGPRILPSGSGRRLNDAAADPAGRLLVGSLSLLPGGSSTETLSIVDHDGSVRVLDADLTLSNGLGWTADGTRMYSVDTLRRRISVRDYDATTGGAGMRCTFLELQDGFPDGLTLDAEDHVWVAVWGRGEVHRYSPAGELVVVVDVPAPHASSVAFAGPLLETLVITTATQDLDEAALARFPDSGKIFTAVPGPLGVPQPLWGGFDRPDPAIDS